MALGHLRDQDLGRVLEQLLQLLGGERRAAAVAVRLARALPEAHEQLDQLRLEVATELGLGRALEGLGVGRGLRGAVGALAARHRRGDREHLLIGRAPLLVAPEPLVGQRGGDPVERR
ncbi:MAG: small, acid-soluble spore protein, alpha/beta type [Chloroflexi bacterium]|nr:small, acid-soluble spore protein, alpha/beta type [Chloroflexota bacterium]